VEGDSFAADHSRAIATESENMSVQSQEAEATQLLSPIERPMVTRVQDQAVIALRQAILSGVLKPGERLVDRRLCQALDIGRNTLREAFRQLEAEGFVTRVPHQGITVAKMSAEEARDIYDLREVLECHAVGRFTDFAEDALVTALHAATSGLREAFESSNVTAMLERKRNFYEVLYKGAANAALHEYADLLSMRLFRLRALSLSRPGRPQQSIDEIDRAVRLIVERRRDDAVAQWRTHIRNAASAALSSGTPW
jgi:DNA-binding GntR family transcriptional regulator